METYHGHVRTPTDAIILFEACRMGLLPRVQRRLSEKERQSIKSGSVFVWDEREAGMRRWTDGKSWSASRVSGSFLTYREMEGKRSGGNNDKTSNRDGVNGQDGDSDGGPDGYRYKPDGLMKQSFSISTTHGQHLHLISYFSRASSTAQTLMQPSNDPQLRHIRPEKGMYPDSTANDQNNIPPVTRGPMTSPGYTHAPAQHPPYTRQPSYPYSHPSWAPPSPMHTPPAHSPYSPYYHGHQGSYPGPSPMHAVSYPHSQPPPTSYAPPPMTAFDRPPPPMSNTGLPPPPPLPYSQPSPQHSYQAGYPPPPPPLSHGTYSYPPPPVQSYPPAQQPTYDSRPHPGSSYPGSTPSDTRLPVKEEPQASRHGPVSTGPPILEHSMRAGPPPSASFAQTIPSISAMLNVDESGQSPSGTASRTLGDLTRGHLQDIPSHKLGFEANRDVQALRNLDKSTFKQY